MKTKNASFTIKPFKNRNGAISYRVAGRLLGERIRKNFKKREDAILERSTLQLKQAQTGSNLRIVSTFMSDSRLVGRWVGKGLPDPPACRKLEFCRLDHRVCREAQKPGRHCWHKLEPLNAPRERD